MKMSSNKAMHDAHQDLSGQISM